MGTPSFSIVIPSYQGVKKLPALLAALDNGIQHLTNSCEVIFVLDASSDGSAQVLKGYSAIHPGTKLSIIENSENLGPSYSRNIGVNSAQNEVILFLDDDCLPSLHWFTRQKEIWSSASNQVAGVGGYVRPHKLETFSERYAQLFNPIQPWALSDSTPSIFKRIRKYYFETNPEISGVSYFAGANMSFSRSRFLSVSGFPSQMRVGEDIAICQRIRDAYGDDALLFDSDLIMDHEYPQKFNEMISKKFRYGRELALQAESGRIAFSINPGPTILISTSLTISALIGVITPFSYLSIFILTFGFVSTLYAAVTTKIKLESKSQYLSSIKYGFAFISIEVANNLGTFLGICEAFSKRLVRRF
jgi:glycosyltransferase involved in cell wall biosynthesis